MRQVNIREHRNRKPTRRRSGPIVRLLLLLTASRPASDASRNTSRSSDDESIGWCATLSTYAVSAVQRAWMNESSLLPTMRFSGKIGMIAAGKTVERRLCSHSKSEKRRHTAISFFGKVGNSVLVSTW